MQVFLDGLLGPRFKIELFQELIICFVIIMYSINYPGAQYNAQSYIRLELIIENIIIFHDNQCNFLHKLIDFDFNHIPSS